MTEQGNPSASPAHTLLRLFPALRERPILAFLLTGEDTGATSSWREALGPLAQVVSVGPADLSTQGVMSRVGDASSSDWQDRMLDEFGLPDLIVDMVSREAGTTIAMFTSLYPRLARAGLYVVSSLSASYDAGMGGGMRRGDSFVDLVRLDLIDEMQHAHTLGELPPTSFSALTRSLIVQDGLIAIERR